MFINFSRTSTMHSIVNVKPKIKNFTGNNNRHVSILTNRKSVVKPPNHKAIKRSIPSPRTQNVDNYESSFIARSIKVNPDITLRDLLGAMTHNSLTNHKLVNEVSSEAALRTALGGDDDDDDDGNIELKVTLKGTSISLIPILNQKNSQVKCPPQQDIADLSKVTQRPILQQKKFPPKPILKKPSSVLTKAANSQKSSRKSSLSSCESSEFSLESEPPATKAYPKYFVVSRRTSSGRTKCSAVPISKQSIKLKTCKADFKALEVKKSRTTNENNSFLPKSENTRSNKLVKLRQLLAYQHEFNELHCHYQSSKEAWNQFCDKEKQMMSNLSRPSLNMCSLITKTSKSECKNDKSLTSLESFTSGDVPVVSRSQVNTSVFLDISKKKRPAPPPPTDVKPHEIIKTASAPSRQKVVQSSWEYFDPDSNKDCKRPAPEAPPPKKPFVSDLLSEGRRNGRIYSSKVVVAPKERIEIPSGPPKKMPEVELSEDKSRSDKKKRPPPPPPPPRKINMEFGSQIYPIEPPYDKREKPRVSFADGEILDEQWKKSIQEFNLSSHYKEQTYNDPPSQYKEQLNNSARQEKGGGQRSVNKTRESYASESCELLESRNETKTIQEVIAAAPEVQTKDKSQFVTTVQKKEKRGGDETNNAGKEIHVTVASTKTTITFEEYVKTKLSTKTFHNLPKSSMSQFPISNNKVSTDEKHHHHQHQHHHHHLSKQTPILTFNSPPESESPAKVKSSSRSSPAKVKSSSPPQVLKLKPCPPVTNLLELTKEINFKNCDFHNKSQNNGKESKRTIAGQSLPNTEIKNDKSRIESPLKQVQFSYDNDFARTLRDGSKVFHVEDGHHHNQHYNHNHHHNRHHYHDHYQHHYQHHYHDQFFNSRPRFYDVVDDRSPGIELSKLLEISNRNEINPRFSSISPSLSSSIIARAIGSTLDVIEPSDDDANGCKHSFNKKPTLNPEYLSVDDDRKSWNEGLSVDSDISKKERTESSTSVATSSDADFIEVVKPERNRFSKASQEAIHDKQLHLKQRERHKLEDLSNLMKSKQRDRTEIFTDASSVNCFQEDFHHDIKHHHKMIPSNGDPMYHHDHHHHHHNRHHDQDSFNQFCDQENYLHHVDSRFSSLDISNSNMFNYNNNNHILHQNEPNIKQNDDLKEFRVEKDANQQRGDLKVDDTIFVFVDESFEHQFDEFDPFQDSFFSLNPKSDIDTIYEESTDDGDDDDEDDDSKFEEVSADKKCGEEIKDSNSKVGTSNKTSQNESSSITKFNEIKTNYTEDEITKEDPDEIVGGVNESVGGVKPVHYKCNNPCFDNSQNANIVRNMKSSKVSKPLDNFETSVEHPPIQANSFKPQSRVTKIFQKFARKNPTINKLNSQKSGHATKHSSDNIQKKTTFEKQKTSKPSFFTFKTKGNVSNTKPKKSGKQSSRILSDQSTFFSRFKSKHKRAPVIRKACLQSESYSPDISRFSPPPSEYSSESCQPPEIDLHNEMTFLETTTPDLPFNPSFLSSLIPPTIQIDEDYDSENLSELISCHSNSNKRDSLSPSSHPTPLPRRSELVLSISYCRDDVTKDQSPTFTRSPKIARKLSNFTSPRLSLEGSSDDTIINSEETTPVKKTENNFAIVNRKDSNNFDDLSVQSSIHPSPINSPKHLNNELSTFANDANTSSNCSTDIHINKIDVPNIEDKTFPCRPLSPGNIQRAADPIHKILFIDPPNPAKRAFPNLTIKPAAQPEVKTGFKISNFIESPGSSFEDDVIIRESHKLEHAELKINERKNDFENLNLPKEEDGCRNFRKLSFQSYFESNLPRDELFKNNSWKQNKETNNSIKPSTGTSEGIYQFKTTQVNKSEYFSTNKSSNNSEIDFFSKENFSESSNSTPNKNNGLNNSDDDDDDNKLSKINVTMTDHPNFFDADIGCKILSRSHDCDMLKEVRNENNQAYKRALHSNEESIHDEDDHQSITIDTKSIFPGENQTKLTSTSGLTNLSSVLKSNLGIVDIPQPSSLSSSSITSLESSSGSLIISTSRPQNETKRQPGKFLFRDSFGDFEHPVAISNPPTNQEKNKETFAGRFCRRSYLADGCCINTSSMDGGDDDDGGGDDDDSKKWESGGVARSIQDLFMSPLKMPYECTG